MEQTFGDRLRMLRLEKGMKQRDLAKVVDRDPSAVSYWENNTSQPEIQVLVKLANTFDVSLDWLLGATTERNPIAKRYYTGRELAEQIGKSWGIDPETDLDYLEFLTVIKKQDITPELLQLFMPAILKFKTQMDELSTRKQRDD